MLPPAELRALTGDLRQFAGIRRIVLDDGPERGVQALAFSTGGGLDFWVLPDRAMDIGPLWWQGRPAAWQSPAGFRHPGLLDPAGEGGRGFERAFSGFMMTCGLDQTRQPAAGLPLHGRLHALPARLLALVEDFDAPVPLLACEGEIAQWRHGAENLLLRRRIEAPVGGTTLTIRDRVTNRGREPQRHALLYHANLGFPFLQPGVRLEWPDGEVETIGPPDAQAVPLARCRALPAGAQTAEIRLVRPDGSRLTLAFGAGTLTHLQVWRDLRPGSYVLSLEPCTDARGEDGRTLDPRLLAPGESRDYRLAFSFAA